MWTWHIWHMVAIAPDAPNLVIGDFNHCKLGKTLCSFEQYITCPTRRTNCLDLCYGLVKGAYKSLQRAPLGTSHHCCVYLVPYCKPVQRKHKPERRIVLVWSHDFIQRLQDCFGLTDWDLFTDACHDLDGLTETVSDYVNFCEELIIPKKSVYIFPNNMSQVCV